MRRTAEVLSSAVIWIVGLAVAVPALLLIILMAVLLPVRIYNRPGRALLRLIVWIFGGRVKAEGVEQLDPDKTYLFMPNHVSLFDIPWWADTSPTMPAASRRRSISAGR